MTTLKSRIMRAADLAFDKNDLRPLIEALAECAERAYYGAFHHSGCPWLHGGECCCAKKELTQALANLERVVGGEG